MVLENKGKFSKTSSGSGIVIIRKSIVDDSQFFLHKGMVRVRIDPKKKVLVISQ